MGAPDIAQRIIQIPPRAPRPIGRPHPPKPVIPINPVIARNRPVSHGFNLAANVVSIAHIYGFIIAALLGQAMGGQEPRIERHTMHLVIAVIHPRYRAARVITNGAGIVRPAARHRCGPPQTVAPNGERPPARQSARNHLAQIIIAISHAITRAHQPARSRLLNYWRCHKHRSNWPP